MSAAHGRQCFDELRGCIECRAEHKRAANAAFAAVKADGSVVAWGIGCNGGDTSCVKMQLTEGMQQIRAERSTFAAVKADGSVVP